MNPAAYRWIESLPLRGAVLGLIVALVWTAVSVTLIGAAPSFRGSLIVTGVVLVPVALLGFAWGWNERLALRDAAANGEDGVERRLADEYHFAQAGRGAACGVAYGLFIVTLNTLGLMRAGSDPVSAILGPVLVGGVIGVIAGNVMRVGLRRRLRRAPATGDVPTGVSGSSAVVPGGDDEFGRA